MSECKYPWLQTDNPTTLSGIYQKIIENRVLYFHPNIGSITLERMQSRLLVGSCVVSRDGKFPVRVEDLPGPLAVSFHCSGDQWKKKKSKITIGTMERLCLWEKLESDIGPL